MKRNYQKELDMVISRNKEEGERPSLFLHSCCAPCSSYVLEYLTKYFRITLFYYNPNITDKEEYGKRICEVKRLVGKMGLLDVDVVEGSYEPSLFFDMAAKCPGEREGGRRCYECYRMRLYETARRAHEGGYDYFTTTLSISPHKNAVWLNELSEEAAQLFGSCALPADFKKKDGYKRSIELSAEYNLYRQDYCGCVFSKEERKKR